MNNKAPTKRLKRESKHATLLSRISKTAPGSKVSKRRRPFKKLVTGLQELEDALPDTSNDRNGADGNQTNVKIKHKSLKSRPGAGKKKEKLVAMEMERFKMNMALMAAGSMSTDPNNDGEVKRRDGGGNDNPGATASRWAAIRGFISQTMEKRPEGVQVEGKG